MSKISRFFCTLLALHQLGSVAVFGYGAAGHKVVADIAEHYLKGTRAETEIRQLLRPKETLADAATWADRAKIPEEYLTNEMKEFVAANPEHRTYHYCDIPFQETAYRADSVGAGPNDIVHIMRECIAVLQLPISESAEPRRFSRRIALLLLAHLVGDIHQPLHVGTSYVDAENRFVNPNTGDKGQGDAGANYFKLTKATSLHGYWDTVTVKNARKRAEEKPFGEYLRELHPPQRDWKPVDPLTSWPEKWANHSLSLSPACFEGITISDRVSIPADEEHPAHFEWKVALAPEYADRSTKVVERQLVRAGHGLAELLKGIWPE